MMEATPNARGVGQEGKKAMAPVQRVSKSDRDQLVEFYLAETTKLEALWARCTDMSSRAILREIISEAEESMERLRGNGNGRVRPASRSGSKTDADNLLRGADGGR
ncbi:MAG: hypothetical protein IT562_15860 [Alphaproteobacteria bacterium]|nr:hypothetical protein [Alphaproteobacteria bacterium]